MYTERIWEGRIAMKGLLRIESERAGGSLSTELELFDSILVARE